MSELHVFCVASDGAIPWNVRTECRPCCQQTKPEIFTVSFL